VRGADLGREGARGAGPELVGDGGPRGAPVAEHGAAQHQLLPRPPPSSAAAAPSHRHDHHRGAGFGRLDRAGYGRWIASRSRKGRSGEERRWTRCRVVAVSGRWSGLSPVPPACCFSGPARVGDWDFCELLFLGPRRANLGAADPGGTARERACARSGGAPRRAAPRNALFTRRFAFFPLSCDPAACIGVRNRMRRR